MNAFGAIIFIGVPLIIVAGLFWRILREEAQLGDVREQQFAPEVELSPLAITTMDYKDKHMIVGG